MSLGVIGEGAPFNPHGTIWEGLNWSNIATDPSVDGIHRLTLFTRSSEVVQSTFDSVKKESSRITNFWRHLDHLSWFVYYTEVACNWRV